MKIIYLAIIGAAVLFWSCSKDAQIERGVITQSIAGSQPAASFAIKTTPATASEVNATLQRIFADSVHASLQERSFTTGDFNGDGSLDLAALVRPNDSGLKRLNDPLANWTIQDATQVFVPPANQRVVFLPPKPNSPWAHSKEVLLAIVHGYGPNGWRDPNARQAYLVRHAGTGPLETRPAPEHIDGSPASQAYSAVIFEPARPTGFLFWTGSQYAWRAEPQSLLETPKQRRRDRDRGCCFSATNPVHFLRP